MEYNTKNPSFAPIDSFKVTDESFEINGLVWNIEKKGGNQFTSKLFFNAVCKSENVIFKLEISRSIFNNKLYVLVGTIIIKSGGQSDFQKSFYLDSRGFKAGARELLAIWQKQLEYWQKQFNFSL
jgi:hypothetical protein